MTHRDELCERVPEVEAAVREERQQNPRTCDDSKNCVPGKFAIVGTARATAGLQRL